MPGTVGVFAKQAAVMARVSLADTGWIAGLKGR
jgi:hypothetical protein